MAMYGTCVIVAGMHRSGTSLVAGALSRAGVTFGEKLLPAKEDNPKGFYEHIDLLEINEAILRTLASSYDDVAPLPSGWWKRIEILPFKTRIQEVIERDFGKCTLFGFKDPRLCLLLPLYIEALAELGIVPRVVVVSRNAGEIAQSLLVRNNFSYAKSLQLIRKYIDSLETNISSLQVCRVAMEEFVQRPAATIDRIRDELWLPLLQTEQITQSLAVFVDHSLKHHAINDLDFMTLIASRWESEREKMQEEYGVLEQKLETSSHDFAARIDALQAHLHAAQTEHDNLMRAIEMRDNDLRSLNEKVAHMNTSILDLNAKYNQQVDQTVSAHAEIASVYRMVSHRDARIADLEFELGQANSIASDVSALQHALDSIERSTTWKMIRLFQRCVDALIPEGTAPRRVYNRTIISLQSIGERKKSPDAHVESEEKMLIEGPIDILFVTHEESRTGAPRVLLEVAKAAFRVHSMVVASKAKGGLHDDFKKAFGERLVYPAQHCASEDRFEIARQTLLQLKPKVVYVNSIVSHEYAYVAKEMGLQVIFHVHEIGDAFDRAIEKSLHSSFKDCADVFMAVSESTRSYLVNVLGCEPSKVSLIHEFIKSDFVRAASLQKKRRVIEEEMGVTPNTKVVLALGTFDRRKGADLFVKTAKKVLKQYSDVKFIWVGRGPLPHEGLLETMREYSTSFYHINEVENPFPYLARADVFYLASREDPFPLVVLEAMALGIPVVAFEKSGGAPEALGTEAGIVLSETSVSRAAEAIASLLSDGSMAKKLGKAGIERQKLYEQAALLPSILSLLETHMTASKAVVSSPDVVSENYA